MDMMSPVGDPGVIYFDDFLCFLGFVFFVLQGQCFTEVKVPMDAKEIFLG